MLPLKVDFMNKTRNRPYRLRLILETKFKLEYFKTSVEFVSISLKYFDHIMNIDTKIDFGYV